jgi:cell volume regulation protein A
VAVGLSATPTNLIADAPAGILIALVLMFFARPIAVAVCSIAFRFPWREQVFISWVGLRGAVPIILALFPLLARIGPGELVLDIAIFVVLISLGGSCDLPSPRARGRYGRDVEDAG